jgi:hypothetical protein
MNLAESTALGNIHRADDVDWGIAFPSAPELTRAVG